MQPRPPVVEDTLKSGQVQIERKTLVLTLKENPRGRFLRITEEARGHRNAIIIPAPGLEEFKKLLDEMVKASNEIPDESPEPAGTVTRGTSNCRTGVRWSGRCFCVR